MGQVAPVDAQGARGGRGGAAFARWWLLVAVALVTVLAPACSDDPAPVQPDVTEPPIEPQWQLVATELPEALLSVSGSAADDVWVVGADAGDGPLIARFDGGGWSRYASPIAADLWWVHAVSAAHVYAGGSQGTILRLVDNRFERMTTPGLARHTVFGIWGAAPDDVWAVGGVSGRDGFIWHYDGLLWQEVALPDDTPELPNGERPGLFKVWGDSSGTVWVVGGQGTVLRRPAGATEFEVVELDAPRTLFTVHARGDRVIAVGGESFGVAYDLAEGAAPRVVTPAGAPLLQGVCVEPDGEAWLAGAGGAVYHMAAGEETFTRVEHGLAPSIESLHAVWVDPEGNVWAVGGDVLTASLGRGAIVRFGAPIAALDPVVTPPPPPFTCPEALVQRGAHRSVARRWLEQNLAAIRRDLPRPGVHARNLYHLSVALHDVWALWQDDHEPWMIDEPAPADRGEDEREALHEAMSYAAYRVLSHRYVGAVGGDRAAVCFRAVMEDLGYDPDDTVDTGESPRAIGNRAGRAVIAAAADDGANEHLNYAPSVPYVPHNPALRVDQPGTVVADPIRWQPLNLAVAVTQNGIPEPGGDQPYIGPHWGDVTPFAITRPAPGAPYFDGGPMPELGPDMDLWVADLLTRAARLDAFDGAMMDISPGAYGNNSLGADDGAGYPTNPVTGEPYAPQVVPRGDFGRVLAEYWADGPSSETPPGHWNTIAHGVVDHPLFENRWNGVGEPLDALEWDVRMYLVLNGALHDAAIAAWEIKRIYETARPITLVRYMGGLGQSSEPDGPSYHPQGLPLVPGIIEVITPASSATGQRHAHLAPYVGQIAVYSWPGEPGDTATEVSPVRWMRAVEWVPYQRATFVSPGFPGLVSGHSTFSRAAAEVLTWMTGSAYFPGGLAEFVAVQDEYLHFERGPSVDVRLQWATYQDAADQAGQSRIWGGIHILPDDFMGRTVGYAVGARAIDTAEAFLP